MWGPTQPVCPEYKQTINNGTKANMSVCLFVCLTCTPRAEEKRVTKMGQKKINVLSTPFAKIMVYLMCYSMTFCGEACSFLRSFG